LSTSTFEINKNKRGGGVNFWKAKEVIRAKKKKDFFTADLRLLSCFRNGLIRYLEFHRIFINVMLLKWLPKPV